MNDQIQATIIDAVNIMYQLNLAGQDVYLTNGQLSIALSLPDELLSNEVKKFVTSTKNEIGRNPIARNASCSQTGDGPVTLFDPGFPIHWDVAP